MGIGMDDAAWQAVMAQYFARHSTLPETSTNYYTYPNQTNVEQSSGDTLEISTGNNKCTDGEDDGHIGIFSRIGNIAQGVGKSLVGVATNIVKHPLKTAAAVGVCCIYGIGPIIGAGFALYGIYNGIKTISNGLKVANNAKTDAEAKAAYESIGSGGFTTAASAFALKGSVGVIKGQVGEIATAATNAKALPNATTGDVLAQVGKTVTEGTMNNVKAVGTCAIEKAKNVYGKYKYLRNAIDEGKGATQIFSEAVDNLSTKATAKVQSTLKKVGDKADEISSKCKETFSKKPVNLEKIKATLEEEGYELIETMQNGTQAFKKGNEIEVYDKYGNLKTKTVTSQNGECHKYTYNKNGTVVKEEITSEVNTGNSKTSYKTTKNLDKNGETQSSTTVTKEQEAVLDKDGNPKVDENGAKEYKTTSEERVVEKGEYSHSTKTAKGSKKTSTYSRNNEVLTSRVQKAWAKYQMANKSATFEKFIDYLIDNGEITIKDLALLDMEAIMLTNQNKEEYGYI